VREGYDLWARIVDAGSGTGMNLRRIVDAGARPVGLDFSWGMLRVAQRSVPGVPLAQADLHDGLPLRRRKFDGVLCALVSEHLRNLRTLCTEAFAVLRKNGRLVFSAFHPEIARAGVEANFEHEGVEYRLGAEPYTTEDYLNNIYDAGFRDLRWHDYRVDADLVTHIPWASKYLGQPLLLIVEAERPDFPRG